MVSDGSTVQVADRFLGSLIEQLDEILVDARALTHRGDVFIADQAGHVAESTDRRSGVRAWRPRSRRSRRPPGR